MYKFSSLAAAAVVAGSILISTNSFAAKELKTDAEKFSYTIGYQIGFSLKRESMEVDAKLVAQAIEDVLKGRKPAMSEDDMRAAYAAGQQRMAAKKAEKGKAAKKKGEDFLAKNKSKKGIKTTKSGLQYKVVKKGKGKQPKTTDTVVVHYKGTLIDGTVFDSSYQRNQPLTIPLTNVIKGWQEAMPMMKTGSKWQVYIPSDLAYGPNGAGGNIGPNEALIFDIELIDIKAASKPK